MTDPVRRVHYFSGQLLRSEDLQAEQDYHRRMRYVHNRLLGTGVVEGLELSVDGDSTVIVGPGLAIDDSGREIVLTDAVALAISEPAEPADPSEEGCAYAVVAIWGEQPDGFVPTADASSDEPAFTRWLERPELALVPTDQLPPDAVVLGRLVLSGKTATLDASSRDAWRRA